MAGVVWSCRVGGSHSIEPQPYPLSQDHPWQTAIVPIVAICGNQAIAIGAGFTVASLGLVLTPAVIPVAALQRPGQSGIACLLGQGMQNGRQIGRLAPVGQIYVHAFTDLALLQLLPPGPFPILPFSLTPPALGSRLVVAGYAGIEEPGTIQDTLVIHDWQLTAYSTSVAAFSQSPRKQGPPAELMLLTDNRCRGNGFLGGPIFSLPESNPLPYSPVCAVTGQYTSAGQPVAYGMSPTPALGLHLGGHSFYELAQAGDLTAIDGLNQFQLETVDDRYSVPHPIAQDPTAWLLRQGLELGYYSAGDIPVVRYSPTLHSQAKPPAMTANHEKAHMSLTVNTAYGSFICELAGIVRWLEQLQDPHYQSLGECMKRLMEGSWLTQEAGATMVELISAPASAGPDAAASMRHDLPPMYAHAVDTLETIMGTLHLPFAPGLEPLRASFATSVCGAALNTGIIDYFKAKPSTDAAAILAYLSDPATHPDTRLNALVEAAGKNPAMLDPIAPSLVALMMQLEGPLKAAKSHEEWVRCFVDAGRRVDHLIQQQIASLWLFPVAPWIETSMEEIDRDRARVRRSILTGTGIDQKQWPQVTLKTIDYLDYPEKQSFDALDHSHEALRATTTAPFPAWLEHVQAIALPPQGRLVFSAAPIPHLPDGGLQNWTCYLSSLTIAPGEIIFNRKAIEFDTIPESDFVAVLETLKTYSMPLTVHRKLMPVIAAPLERVLQRRPFPLFQYLPTVSPNSIVEQLQIFDGPARARILLNILAANQIVSVQAVKPGGARLLWFESGAAANSYRNLLQARGIPIDDGGFDINNQDDVDIVLAAWMCTYGAMGDAKTSF